jgi:hypothetical protein
VFAVESFHGVSGGHAFDGAGMAFRGISGSIDFPIYPIVA